MANLNFVSAYVADGALFVHVKGEFRGEARIRCEIGPLVPHPGEVRGLNVDLGHRFARYLSIAGILIGLTAEQEADLYELLGVQPLPDAPDCPTHSTTKMDPTGPGAWACPKCCADAAIIDDPAELPA